ncbi:uncharacterized protein LOC143622097 [Bidens hawaiensis]|uniref:uncharacterized protein LOC143622097 n=1 Tax=Bidens hawaiensis TaxID=980011 RepID=UPI00404B4CE0
MSGRHRRHETYWNNKEEKRASNISPGRSQNWSKSEAHDDMMHGNYSRSPSRDGPKYDDISRDRSRMYSHSTHDGWDKQYNTRPSDDSYGPPSRSRDKGAGGDMRMTRERDRTRSPNRSRSRSRDRMSRSSRENARGPRHEINAAYPNMRNDSKDFDSRGAGNNNITESWTRRPDHKGDSRYNDNRNTRIQCRYFTAGNCNRDDCGFSHDISDSVRGYDDNRNLGNRNRTSHNDRGPHSPHGPRSPHSPHRARGPHDGLNAASNFGEMEKKKPWNGSAWDDVESGGFNGTFDDTNNNNNNNNNTRFDNNNNNNTWDSRDDKKMKKWAGPTWDEFDAVKTDDKKVRKWDGQGLTENPVNESDLNNMVSEDANQQSHMVSSNPLNGQGYVRVENQDKEASLTSQPVPQPNVVPETSHKGQISQIYSESNLTSAIDYLKSLPISAYNQEDVTRAKGEQNLEVKISQPIDAMNKEAVEPFDKMVANNNKKEENNITNSEDVATHDKIDEGDSGNDEKATRLFKIGLAEFVKDMLKPKWREGKMSRDDHKTVVKKVVEKVTNSIHGSQIPKTQPKIDQYLANNKPKITKLVEAYVEKHVKS